MNLSEFLLARIAEDEALARAAGDDPWEVSEEEFGTFHVSARNEAIWKWAYLDEDKARHIARHDPARVLAECEAKRRIVETRERLWRRAEELIRADRFDDAKTARQLCAGIEMVIPLLALPYADHPDYAEAWRP